jgi:hypothetical protein
MLFICEIARPAPRSVFFAQSAMPTPDKTELNRTSARTVPSSFYEQLRCQSRFALSASGKLAKSRANLHRRHLSRCAAAILAFPASLIGRSR